MHDKELNGKQKFLETLSMVFQKYRLLFIGMVLVIVLFIIGYGVFTELDRSAKNKAILTAEKIETAFAEWNNATETDKDAKLAALVDLIDTTKKTGKNTYAEQRAVFVNAQMLFTQEKYAEAAVEFADLAMRFPKSYLATIAAFNAGSSYENAGDSEAALKEYLAFDGVFSDAAQAPHALFACARLYEGKSDYIKADEFYNKILDKFPSSNWTNMAKSRIIFLETSGKFVK